MWPKVRVETTAVGLGRILGFEMPELHGTDRWMSMRGCAWSNDATEQQQLSPAQARELVEQNHKRFCGFVSIGDRDDCVLMCKSGGSMLDARNGVPANYTCHLFRTHGLPPAKFTDKFVEGLRPGRGEGLKDTEPHLSLFGSISPTDLAQGTVGDCWLVSALAAAAEFPHLLLDRCKQSKISAEGRYVVELFHPVKDK